MKKEILKAIRVAKRRRTCIETLGNDPLANKIAIVMFEELEHTHKLLPYYFAVKSI